MKHNTHDKLVKWLPTMLLRYYVTYSFWTHDREIQVAVYLKKLQTSRKDACCEKQNTYRPSHYATERHPETSENFKQLTTHNSPTAGKA